MNKRDAKKFEKLLLAECAHLSQGIRRIEQEALSEPDHETSGDFSAYAEVGTDNFERETALNIASGEAQWLRGVNEALEKIRKGTYGVCEGCEKDIPRKRLEVFPSAKYCIQCQEKLEKEGML